MNNYREYIPQLMSMPLFRGIDGEDIVKLLTAMEVDIVCHKKGMERSPLNGPDIENDLFCIGLTGTMLPPEDERDEVYQNSSFDEVGMMMAEIPVFSEMLKKKGPPKGKFPPHPMRPNEVDRYMLRFSPDQFTTYIPEVAEAQGKMVRNMLGLLAQKVTNVRKEKRAVEEELKELKGEE